MEISKKDLLKETGISYGQLYRWKREGLIPEEWFVKRSTHTGQETYFPREAILKRIAIIQQLKDHYSLEEMAAMLTPDVGNRTFSEEDLETFEEIRVDVAAGFMDRMQKDEFSFREVVVMTALSSIFNEYKIAESNQDRMIEAAVHGLHIMNRLEFMLVCLCMDEHYYIMLVEDDTSFYIDGQFEIEKKISLQELANNLKLKYKHTFQFAFDEEEQYAK